MKLGPIERSWQMSISFKQIEVAMCVLVTSLAIPQRMSSTWNSTLYCFLQYSVSFG